MKMMNRLAVLAATLMGMATAPALAESYPDRPVTVLIGYAAGSSTDLVGRIVTQGLAEEWGQPVVVANRGGAAGNLAAGAAAKSAPDGYTLLFAQNGLAISVALNPKLQFDGNKDLTPVAMAAATPHILVVNPSSPAKSVKDLIDLAKKKPGQLNFSSAGIGNSDHMAGEMFKAMTGIETTHVPYRGGNAAASDVVGGQIDYYFAGMPVGLPLHQSGRLRALAVTSKQRFPGAPELPTMQEAGLSEYEHALWQGFFVPAGTPQAIIDKISSSVLKVLAKPEIKERFATAGIQIAPMNQAEFAALYHSDIERWKKIAATAHIKLD